MKGHIFDRSRGRLINRFDWLMLVASFVMIGWILLPR
jgi:hypothetical protein